MVGIYKITSPTGRVYIGQSWNIEKRKQLYKSLKCERQGKLYNSLTRHSWNKHTFSIIHELPFDTTQQVLDSYETLYLSQYISCGCKVLNIKDPGSRGRHSEESKKKISQSKMGHVVSIETRLLISKSGKGRIPWNKGRKNPFSESTRQKMSNSKKGRALTEQHRSNIVEATKGLPKTVEHGHKISEAKKGVPSHKKGKVGALVTCPHCNKIGRECGMKVWHFNNCKNKT